jgi:Holliday junction resolvase RusA-like endonuclease
VSDALVEFAVRGKPEPRGSKQPYVVYKNRATKEPARREDGSIIVNMTDDNVESQAWMAKVAAAGRVAWKHQAPLEEVAVEVALVFFVYRPGDQHGTGRNERFVKDHAPARPRKKPDLDKLARGTLDALSGVIWKDDNLIVGMSLDKRYAVPQSATDDGQGVVITVGLAEQQTASQLPLDLRERWIEPVEEYAEDSLLGDLAKL